MSHGTTNSAKKNQGGRQTMMFSATFPQAFWELPLNPARELVRCIYIYIHRFLFETYTYILTVYTVLIRTAQETTPV